MIPAIDGKPHSINLKKVRILISSVIMRFICLIDIVNQTINITIGAITSIDFTSFLKIYLKTMLVIRVLCSSNIMHYVAFSRRRRRTFVFIPQRNRANMFILLRNG